MRFSDKIVFYFNKKKENNQNKIIEEYIDTNFSEIEEQFLEQDFSFFVFPNKADIKTLKDIYLYCFPEFHLLEKEMIGDNISLDSFYNNSINSGFLIIQLDNIIITEYNDAIFHKIDNLYKNLQPTFTDIFFNRKKKINSVTDLDNISLKNFYKKQLLPSRLSYLFGKNKPILKPNLVEQIKNFNYTIYYKYHTHNPNILYSLRDSTKEEELAKWLKEIENKLERINNSEELFDTIIRLEKLTNQITTRRMILTKDSLQITSDYQILLPSLNNMEISMSDLTKAVYILFCKHPMGINIKELANYKNELLDIYRKISKLNDYDKMKMNIDKICKIDSKEIYVHLSRIKKAFESKMAPYYAKKFIVGNPVHGKPLKFIKVLLMDVIKN
ncbi:hypothetical protein [Tenacibaculum finnmarkense]|uniref:hypothetical protein n=1 Tax=Tenacibaculum finnmarkense TaxID=2781243 RepID=UPI001E53DE93|nr:hypothetical protein [Tenacibaculum finnmarkense]MCD8408850.1 hypothetical protein [Tenacibaculum finnmarkense genomovar ulcerans]